MFNSCQRQRFRNQFVTEGSKLVYQFCIIVEGNYQAIVNSYQWNFHFGIAAVIVNLIDDHVNIRSNFMQ